MSLRSTTLPRPASTRIVSATGCLRSEHFFITADHLLIEVDPAGFRLVGAIAEGHVEVHMLGGDGEYVVLAESGVFQSERQRIVLNGWKGTRENGVAWPPTVIRREVLLPTDGTFFLPAWTDDPGDGADAVREGASSGLIEEAPS